MFDYIGTVNIKESNIPFERIVIKHFWFRKLMDLYGLVYCIKQSCMECKKQNMLHSTHYSLQFCVTLKL